VRILVIGAGALGGYFGARLLAAGRDVAFLVRPKRAAALAKSGLSVKSNMGNLQLPAPPAITADKLNKPFDVIILSCKAYDLEEAMQSFAPAVGKDTVIIPLLNGLRHVDVLSARFGAETVFGGQCAISATLSPEGEILHLADMHTLTFGPQESTKTPKNYAEIVSVLSDANFIAQPSDIIMQEMWEKWVFIATAAGSTCLMRASVGDMINAGASELVMALFDECVDIATEQGFEPRAAFLERARSMFTTPGSPLMASMLRDIEKGSPTEGDHIIGDMLSRSATPSSHSLLKTAHAHVKSYEARRARETAA
jgi:2-dehydropantoate 2-reductase